VFILIIYYKQLHTIGMNNAKYIPGLTSISKFIDISDRKGIAFDVDTKLNSAFLKYRFVTGISI